MRARAALFPAFFSLFLWGAAAAGEAPQDEVRRPQVAGLFYPASPAELSALVERLLAAAPAKSMDGKLRALIVPHAGYQYSAATAAAGYKLLAGSGVKDVIIIGSNHTRGTPPFVLSVAAYRWYETPLGRVPVSQHAAELLRRPPFRFVPATHDSHVEEVQLAFLQRTLTDFSITPISTGSLDNASVARAASLIVISSDLSHG